MKKITTYHVTLGSVLLFCSFSGMATEEKKVAETSQKQDMEVIVVTGNHFPQPISSVLAPMQVITKEDIHRW